MQIDESIVIRNTNDIKKRKEQTLKNWLFEFNFCDITIAAKLMKVSIKTAYRDLKRMKDLGLIKKQEIMNNSERISLYSLTNKGFKDWNLGKVGGENNAIRFRDIAGSRSQYTLYHDLQCQYAVIQTTLYRKKIEFEQYQFYSEKHINSVIYNNKRKQLKRVGDALVVFMSEKNNKVSMMIETELTQKSEKRIFWIFNQHLEQIEKKLYQAVYFFFNKKSVFMKYKEVHSRTEWDIVDKVGSNYKNTANKRNVINNKLVKQRFFFQMIEDQLIKKEV